MELQVGVLVRDVRGVEDLLEVLHEGLHHARGLWVLRTLVGDVGHALALEVPMEPHYLSVGFWEIHVGRISRRKHGCCPPPPLPRDSRSGSPRRPGWGLAWL